VTGPRAARRAAGPSLVVLAIGLLGLLALVGLGPASGRAQGASRGARTPTAVRATVAVRAAAVAVRTVVVSGDSVTESATLDPAVVHSEGLDGSLLAAIAKRGVPATDGYLRSHGLSLKGVVVGPLHYDGAWAYAQTDGGPDGYASVTVKPGAAVSFPPGTRHIRLFYTGSTPLVYYHEKTVPIAPDGTIELPDTSARVKLVNTGDLVFDGIQRFPTTGISLDVLGHAAALTEDDLDPGEVAQLRLLAPNQTLILFGTVEEYDQGYLHTMTPHTAQVAFVDGLRERAAIAKASGTCVFVSHAPNDVVSQAIQARYRGIEKEQAKLDGCTYSDILANAFGPPSRSVKAGLTIDSIHPTPAGYRRMAALLAELIVPTPTKPGS
jgi:hypothetical protein